MPLPLMIGSVVPMSDLDWNAKISHLPGTHILQTAEWGKVKSAYGWEVIQKTWQDDQGSIAGAAQILLRKVRIAGLSVPFCVLYVPRGPMLNWKDQELVSRVLYELEQLARKEHALQVKIDPQIILGRGIPGDVGVYETPAPSCLTGILQKREWKFSSEQIQFKNTVFIELEGDEESLLAKMKQKTRYNIRLAQKKGVTVRQAGRSDLPVLFKMYAETSLRDGFTIRSAEYYYEVWITFMDKGMAHGLLAEVEGEPVAGLMLFHFAGKAWYLYGMSSDRHREKMPNYLLQWEAIHLAKQLGCSVYDLWGAPDVFDETDPMWGVYRFKEGLGGEVICTSGAWDFTPYPFLYKVYNKVIPAVMAVLRRSGKHKTESQLAQ